MSFKTMNYNLKIVYSAIAWIVVLNLIFYYGYRIGMPIILIIIASTCSILFFGYGIVSFLTKHFIEKSNKH